MCVCVSSAIVWVLRDTATSPAAHVQTLTQHLRAKGAIHLHNIVIEPQSRGKLLAPSGVARLVGNGQQHTMAFANETDRDRWLAALARAAHRVPARYCATCAQLVDLALCKSTVAASVVRQVLPDEAMPQERFLVFAASHVALYMTSASFGSRMALQLWHASHCS